MSPSSILLVEVYSTALLRALAIKRASLEALTRPLCGASAIVAPQSLKKKGCRLDSLFCFLATP